MRIPAEKILLFGRSIGSGPAIFLASRRKIAGLVLMAPFSNLRTLARDLVGKVAENMIEEKFHNLKDMEVITCPTLFLHGAQDELIPCQHSKDLAAVCQGVKEICISEEMKHNEYRVFADVVTPTLNFMEANLSIVRGETAPSFTMPAVLNERPKLYPPLHEKKSLFNSLFNK
jgi:esterase/lipase